MDKNAYENLLKDFEKKYFDEIIPKLQIYETERKRKNDISNAIWIFIVICWVLCAFIFVFSIFIEALNLLLLGTIFLSAYNVKLKKDFEKTLKKKVMPVICSCFGNITWTDIPPNIDADVYKRINLIPDYNTIKSDDCFTGHYHNTDYVIEEFKAREGSSSNNIFINDLIEGLFALYSGDYNERLVFKGAVVTVKMHKSFNGKTIIMSDSKFHHSPSKDLHHTELEDIEFEKRFDVYTDDDVEARYLITPSLMERLNNMKLAFNAETISVAFNNAKIYIALHTGKDLFSIGSLKKQVCDYEQFKTMFEEIYSIVRLIDYFKLDQKTGL